jgi:hypothetical protein
LINSNFDVMLLGFDPFGVTHGEGVVDVAGVLVRSCSSEYRGSPSL